MSELERTGRDPTPGPIGPEINAGLDRANGPSGLPKVSRALAVLTAARPSDDLIGGAAALKASVSEHSYDRAVIALVQDAALLSYSPKVAQICFDILRSTAPGDAARVGPEFEAFQALRVSSKPVPYSVPTLDRAAAAKVPDQLSAIASDPAKIGALVNYACDCYRPGAMAVANALFYSPHRDKVNEALFPKLRAQFGTYFAADELQAAVTALDPRDAGVTTLLVQGIRSTRSKLGGFEGKACGVLGLVTDETILSFLKEVAFDKERRWFARHGAVEILARNCDAALQAHCASLVTRDVKATARGAAETEGLSGLGKFFRSRALRNDPTFRELAHDDQIAAALIIEKVRPELAGPALMRLTNNAHAWEQKGNWFAHNDALAALRRLDYIPKNVSDFEMAIVDGVPGVGWRTAAAFVKKLRNGGR